MIREALDFKYLLLDNYKRMKISENEVATIFMIDHLISNGNAFITTDLLALKMSLDSKEIDRIVAALLTKGFIEYKTIDNKTVTSLDPLKERLYHEFQVSLVHEIPNEETNIFEDFEKLLCRPLSPVELSQIKEWISMGYSDETIINALKEAIAQGRKSLRNVDKILLNWSIRNDRESEGHSPINDDWNKNLEETIRIAKTPWIDSDDED